MLVGHATDEGLHRAGLVQTDRPPHGRLAVPDVFLQRQVSLSLEANGMLLRILLLLLLLLLARLAGFDVSLGSRHVDTRIGCGGLRQGP